MKIGGNVNLNIRTGNSDWLWILAFFLIGAGYVWAQQDDKNKKVETVFIIHADETIGNEVLLPEITVLRGNVKLRHKGMFMDCDSAYVNERSNTFDAYGNVRMRQGDTLRIYGDYLRYDGLAELAMLRYNCKLENKGTTLLTDSLNYDRIEDKAYYFEGGTMMDQINVLTSEWGEHWLSTKDSKFNYNVLLVNPEYTISTDTLRYNTNNGIAEIAGPSKIDSGENHILAEEGWYNSQTGESELTDRPFLYTESGKTLQGDTVFYDRDQGYSIARQNVILTDTVNKNLLTGEYCYYNERIDSALVTGRALAIDYSQGDSIYLHGDTLKLQSFHQETDSLYRKLYAYYKVRVYKSDFQAVCDSLVFSSADSCIRMYRDPIIWTGEQQQLGEYITIFLNDSTIDQVLIENQALSVEKMDSLHYNQVTGTTMLFHFEEGDISQVDVIGNVVLRYYPLDSEQYLIGMNESETAKLFISLQDRKIHRMKMEGPSNGILHPIFLIPPGKLYLSNFAWFDYVRPLDKDDVFNWRGKKQGTELVYKERKEVPLPNRGLLRKPNPAILPEPDPGELPPSDLTPESDNFLSPDSSPEIQSEFDPQEESVLPSTENPSEDPDLSESERPAVLEAEESRPEPDTSVENAPEPLSESIPESLPESSSESEQDSKPEQLPEPESENE